MVDDIPMGDTFFTNTFFSFSTIESILFWARQIFGVIEQKLNEQTIQMTELKTITDKIELKKKHAVQMADFRTILLKSKIQPIPITITTPIFSVVFSIFVFTFTTERKKMFPKLFTYHKKNQKNQPWYFQIRTKFQMDFTNLSERDRLLYKK